MYKHKKSDCEYLRYQAKQKFDRVKSSWLEAGQWALPHRILTLDSQEPGARNNKHIVDATHIVALRSYVAGFLEGNTSASRPWFRIQHADPELSKVFINKSWLQLLTDRVLSALSSSNFYHAAGGFYYDFGVFNTGAHYIDEMVDGSLFFHNLDPGAYYVINNGYSEAVVLIREFQLTVKAVVDTYGRKKPNGSWDWSNFSSAVKKMYNDGNYTEKITVIHIVKENEDYDPYQEAAGMNKRWISLTYEISNGKGQYYQEGQQTEFSNVDTNQEQTYLKVSASQRKPFIVGKSDSSGNFEYGLKGPTTDSLGSIKSLNKKAIGKDMALDQMLKPTLQGPATLKKSYITNAPNAFIPLDAMSMSQGGLKPVHQINPAIAALNQDVGDLRDQVNKLYYADYLLYLSRNPKTRTAREVDAVVQEQQLIIGPNLQSLNKTYNEKVLDFVIDYVLEEDPYLPPPPPDLQGQFLRTEYISVFAQAQKAADIPSIDRYTQMVLDVGQINPTIFDKINLDKLADLYEDRLFLPAGLNVPESEVKAKREKQEREAQRQKMLNETLPAMAGAAKDLGLAKPQTK